MDKREAEQGAWRRVIPALARLKVRLLYPPQKVLRLYRHARTITAADLRSSRAEAPSFAPPNVAPRISPQSARDTRIPAGAENNMMRWEAQMRHSDSRGHARAQFGFAFRARNFRGSALSLMVAAAMPAWSQLDIGANGTPSYIHAIGVPPGIAGMAPQLALHHAGGGTNGPVGHGWSLQGLSIISRCPATTAIDGAGQRAGVAFDPTDKLCLDGERLIQVNASGAPLAFPQKDDAKGLSGTAVREYRTEKDSFARIRAYGASGGDVANGPSYFKVWTKAGQVYEYGAPPSSDSLSKSLIKVQGRNTVMVWAASRISDVVGNRIDFRYEQRELAWGSGTTAGQALKGQEWNLAEIQYAGNKVVFNYVDRPDGSSTLPSDRAESYQVGAKNVSVRRLSSITTYINSPNTTALGKGPAAVAVATLKLTYEVGPRTGRSRLSEIRECAGDGSTNACLPGTKFSYSAGPDDAFNAVSAFNLTTTKLLDRDGNFGVIPIDFDGDGRLDLLYWSETKAQNRLYRSKGDGSFEVVAKSAAAGAFDLTTEILQDSGGCFEAMVQDINGDGLLDIFRYNDSGSRCAATSGNFVLINSGMGYFEKKSYNGPKLLREKQGVSSQYLCPSYVQGCDTRISYTKAANFFLLDFNGDGLVDILSSQIPAYSRLRTESMNPCTATPCVRAYVATGAGSFTEVPTNIASKIFYVEPSSDRNAGQPKNVADIDGDGFADLIALPGTISALRSHGNGNFTIVEDADSCDRPIDFNGDGRMDCLKPGGLQPGKHSSLQVAMADGIRSFEKVANFNLAGTLDMTGTAGALVVDINGDGRADILRWSDSEEQNELLLSRGNGTFYPSPTFNLKTEGHLLKKSDGTSDILFGDFLGHGDTQLLRIRTTDAGTRLYARAKQLPADTLVKVTSPTGLMTDLTYDTLTAGPAVYKPDRHTTNAATGRNFDLMLPMRVVTRVTSDAGVGTARNSTNYSYAGLKAHRDGRGLLGFREVRSQSASASTAGEALVSTTQYLQDHPYIGAVFATESRRGTLAAPGALLSRTSNVYCDRAGSVQPTAITKGQPTPPPCASTAKVSKPYLASTLAEGWDLSGTALPDVLTTNTYNAYGDPEVITVRTSGNALGLAQTFTKTSTNVYKAADIGGDNWILGRLERSTVQNTVPNHLGSIATSAGTGAQAKATQGTGK